MPQVARLQLGDELQKIAKMLNFVKIVVKLDRPGFLGPDAHFVTVVIAERLLSLAIPFIEFEVKKTGLNS